MEATVSTTRERKAEKDKTQEADHDVLMSNKPLHRFVQKEPRSLGIVIVIFGCVELLMGFQMAGEDLKTSYSIYIPFWLGALFLCCGILSIYTELHPSKKMVTVCLAMYVVSLLGIIVSIGYRIFCLFGYKYHIFRSSYMSSDGIWASNRSSQIFAVELLLLLSSVCVSGLLIFLSIIARFALKSTHTQIILQHIPMPSNGTTTN